MPELPEVNLQVRYLRQRAVGARVQSVGFKGKRQFKATRAGVDEAQAQAALDAFFVGNTLEGVTQRGKLLIVQTPRGLLVSHLMLSGRWSVPGDHLLAGYKTWAEPPPGWSRGVWLGLEDERELVFFTPRWQANTSIHPGLSDPTEVVALSRLGPEALVLPETDPAFASTPWTLEDLARDASRTSRAVKLLLLDQKKVSGLGNRYVCEALYDAGVHPARPARELSRAELEATFTACVDILQAAIDADLDPEATTRIYRREVDPEGRPVEMIKINGRDTFLVPARQPR